MSGAPASGLRPGPVRRGKALRLLRVYRGLSQRQLADQSGTNKATVSSYERGMQQIGASSLDRMLRALELPPRAWESTVRHVDWLDWLHARQKDPGDPFAERRERIAELFGRHREQEVSLYLEVLGAIAPAAMGGSKSDSD